MPPKNTTTHHYRKPRLLWANAFCLLDTSSGASMSVREMLHQLLAQGYDVQTLGCTIFDNPKGAGKLKSHLKKTPAKTHQLIDVPDGQLTHQLLVTKNTYRKNITAHEESLWYSQYLYLLDSFKPDVVWFYGGQTLDLLIADEARARGIPSAFYLANGNYMSPRWSRDVDLVLTDSEATAQMYHQKVGFRASPVGKFIDPDKFIATHHQRKHLLFVNPSWEKGASIIVQLALKLERERPDITLEVVEARADWQHVLRETTRRLGQERDNLPNVVVTANTNDMRPIYERARVLLAPSLWWESGARVLAEAMLNGIPTIVSNHGGSAGLIEDAGVILDFPEACYEPPYQHSMTDDELQPLFETVVNLFNGASLYEEYVEKAWRVGRERHHIDVSTRRLTRALGPLVKKRAGNKDFLRLQRKGHKHHLAGTAGKPAFTRVSTTPQPQSQQHPSPNGHNEPSSKPTSLFRKDVDWQLDSQVIVLDNSATLLKNSKTNTLLKNKALAIIAFDPASQVENLALYEGSDDIQIFPHALLGDGTPTTLHICLDPLLTSTLKPLPAQEVPEAYRQGAQVIVELPIQSIRLDSIKGLNTLDWLILDHLSDSLAILQNGDNAIKDTLVIEARSSIQSTHCNQPDIDDINEEMAHRGFQLYRSNSIHQLNPEEMAASNSTTALFLPSQDRLAKMADADKKKLILILHSFYLPSDEVHAFISKTDKNMADMYLIHISNGINLYNSATSMPNKGKAHNADEDTAPHNHEVEETKDDNILVSGKIIF
ncbi:MULTISPECIES: glycosyltransferase family 4 protein [Halomonadaceae]|uniref:glycosyltransferase family 4 protein n=1 Tax=Halomonadaceae TaxID=28256 RepID=UPI001582D62A|nr:MULTISPECIES: glycosyltransferase family 4 protein [Halomonas]MDI4637797.1 glycosyltransferase family 4 protein [Halomonas sp. BMC7]NUJ58818.1 glycosyltransferase [Halomonas taeanensis]